MHVHIRLFAALADTAGFRTVELELPPGATAGTARDMLVERYPALAGMCRRVALAVNAEYVEPEQPLREGDELALIPPVSGG